MYCLYLLGLFLLLGVDANDQGKSRNDANRFQVILQSQGNSSAIIGSYILPPKQTHELEKALTNVIRNVLGLQLPKLSLRTTEYRNTRLMFTLRMTINSIFRQIKRLFCLIQSIKPEFSNATESNDQTLKSAVYHQLLHVPLKLTAIFREVNSKVSRICRRNKYTKMGYKSCKFQLPMDHETYTDQLKVTSIFGALSAHANNFRDCLNEKEPGSFDLKRAFGEMTNFSPEVTGKKLKNRLGKPVPVSPGKNKEYNEFHAFVCHAVVDDSQLDYHDCLVEMKRIDKCVHKKLNGSLEVTEPTKNSSEDFLRTIKSLDDSCTNADKGLDVLVGCKRKSKATRVNVFPHIVDFFMGDLEKSPRLGRMAKEVGLIISKSRVGSEALNEVATLIEIYKDGVDKKARLMKAAQKDNQQMSFFNKMSSILLQYKQYIHAATLKTVAHMHNIMSTVEKIIVDSASAVVGEDLSANVQTLKSWMGFVDSVVVNWSHKRSQFPVRNAARWKMASDEFIDAAKRSRSKGLIVVPNDVGFIKSPHDEPLDKLIGSLKRLGHSFQPRRSTALTTLANTFLLATMFYECISLLAGAIYHENSISVSSSNSPEIEEESDPWQPSRDRRSSPATDDEDFQTQSKEDEEDPLSLANQTDKVAAPTVNPDHESIQESVGISSDTENPEELQTEDNQQSSTEFLT